MRLTKDKPAPQDAPVSAPGAPARASSETWTQGSALTTKALTVGLWILLACGPVAMVANLLEPAPAAPVAVKEAPPAGEVAAVGESAVQAVRSWLTATREDSAAATAIYPQLQSSRLPKTAVSVSAASVAAVEVEAPRVWSVTVGVDARWPDEAGNLAGAQRLYFEVPVAAAAGGRGASVIALPASVPAPQQVSGVSMRYQTALPTNSALGTTVGEFLKAFLTGAGDVSRYVTPGTDITAVTPAPFTGIETRRVWATDRLDPSAVPTDGKTAQVLVDAAVTPVAGVELTTQYRLELTARAGRWEISQMQGNPAVSVDPDAVAPTTEGANP